MELMIRNEKGFTLTELTVGLFITSFMIIGLVQAFALVTGLGNDQKIRAVNLLQAEAALYTIGSEIRSMGNGIPFEQKNFEIGEPTLNDPTVTHPIDLTESTAAKLKFKINESGRTYMLRSDYQPDISFNVYLVDATGLEAGKEIYITNGVIGEDDGLYGVVSSVNLGNNEIVLSPTPDFSPPNDIPSTLFKAGSLLEQVSNVTYETVSGSIFRDLDDNSVLLANNSLLSFEYLDRSGSALALPLTELALVDDFRNVRVTIAVTSTSNLSSGSPHTSTVSQIFAVRNFNYVF